MALILLYAIPGWIQGLIHFYKIFATLPTPARRNALTSNNHTPHVLEGGRRGSMNISEYFMSRIPRADLYLGLLGLVIFSGILIINHLSMRNTFVTEFSLAICIGCCTYLIIQRRQSDDALDHFELSPLIVRSLNIVFFLLLIVAGVMFQFNQYRPQIYFVVLIVCSAILTVDVLHADSRHYSTWTIVKIFLFSIIIRAHLLYEYPGFYGVDPWVHMFFVQLWQEIGHNPMGITPLVGTDYPPIFHIETLITHLVTGLNLKESLFFSIGFFYNVAIFFIFLFVQKVTNTKIALLSCLLIAINPFHISWGAWLVPTSTGVFFFSLLLYLIHKELNLLSGMIIQLLIVITLVYLHTLSPLTICIGIGVYLAVNYLLSRYLSFDSRARINYRFGTSFVIILIVSLVSTYIYHYYKEEITFLGFVLKPLQLTIETETQFGGGEIASFTASDYPLNRVGFLLIVGITLIGCLFWLRREHQSKERVAIIFTILILMSTAYGPALFNIDNFIPGRWIVFGMVIGVPACAFAIYRVTCIPRTEKSKLITLVATIALVSFFLINNSAVNLRTPFYGELSNDPTRVAFTYGEVQGANTLISISGPSMKINSDNFYRYVFQYYQMEQFGKFIMLNLREPVVEDQNLRVVRSYALTHQEDNFKDIFKKDGGASVNLIYDNSQVRAIWVPDL